MNSKSSSQFQARPSRRPRMSALLALPLALGPFTLSAAERVWDGGARSADWTDAANWTALGGAPVDGDSLRFPAGALRPSNNNDFPAGTSFNTLTYAGAGYTASGNELGLTGGIVISHGAGNTILNLPIDVGANQAFLVSVAGANLFLNGRVELGRTRSLLTFDGAGQTIVSGNIAGSGLLIGDGGIRKNGPGNLYVPSHLTFGGPTTVNGGTLRVDGSLSNSAVTLNAGAALLGLGKVGGLTANSGSTVSPGGTTQDILDSLGDVALNAGSTLNIRLNGTSVGINYDQLRVQGVLTLGGTLNVTASFLPAVGEVFTIIENDGADDVIGTFADLPERAILMINGRPFQISYGGRGTIGGGIGRDVNDVTLEAVPALSVWDGGGGQNKFWNQPLNWVGDAVPMPGDDVQFASAGSDALTTINDFPPGRVFGSIIFGAGRHRLEGASMADLQGSIQIAESNDVAVLMPLTLKGGIKRTLPGRLLLGGPLELSGDQTFWTLHTNSIFWPTPSFGGAYPFITITGGVDVASHDLILRTEPTFAFGGLSPSIRLSGGVVGTGSITKLGAGWLDNYSATVAVPFTLQEGTVSGGDYTSSVLVNTGAVLISYSGSIHELEVHGGRFVPWASVSVGSARYLDGSVFDTDIHWNSTSPTEGHPSSTTVSVGDAIDLSGCTLNLRLESLEGEIPPGSSFTLISRDVDATLTGTFNGLPEGARFVVGGYVFTITYAAGFQGRSVALVTDAPFVWDGGGSGNAWGTAANWQADFAPIPDAALVFPASVSKLAMINAFDAGTRFRSLTFNGPSYLLLGNPFRVSEGIYNDVASGDTTITADLIASGSYFSNRVGSASRLLLEGAVTGNATWRKTGSGTLRFGGSAANDQGLVEVREGELELDKPSGVNAIAATLWIGDGTNDVRATLLADHQIADGATVTIRNRGRLDLNGNDETIGQLQGDGTVSLDGRFVPGRAARLTVNGGSFGGAIVGDGGLTKAGASSSALTLSGPNTFSGLTIISGGTLFVEGTLLNSAIRLDGGILRGRGSVGAITGNLGGTLQPGSGGADFQVALQSKDAALNSATTFRALLTSIDPGYENHRLNVTGTVSLGGSTLVVDLSGSFKPASGRSFLIIDNDGADPVAGTFAGLPEGAIFGGDGLPFRITYAGGTGNDVVLTRVAAPPSTLNSITSLSNRQVRIEGLGIGGVIYPIQAASNLNPVIFWTNVGSVTGDLGGLFRFIDTGASNRPMRYYRAVSP